MSGGLYVGSSSTVIQQQRIGRVANQQDGGNTQFGRIGSMRSNEKQLFVNRLGFTPRRDEPPAPTNIQPPNVHPPALNNIPLVQAVLILPAAPQGAIPVAVPAPAPAPAPVAIPVAIPVAAPAVNIDEVPVLEPVPENPPVNTTQAGTINNQ
ncbi:hypothetical protein [Microbulbifer sp. JMSA003]|uniref:hypothetical protein n=1 Tax=Microbulbifer sp. JMSA003 TaxID=3243369 RepID=UPI00403A4A58